MGNVYELTFGQVDEELLTCRRLELKDNHAAVVGIALNALWRAALDIEDAAGAPPTRKPKPRETSPGSTPSPKLSPTK